MRDAAEVVQRWTALGTPLEVPGARTVSWQSGRGEPVLLLHGMPFLGVPLPEGDSGTCPAWPLAHRARRRGVAIAKSVMELTPTLVVLVMLVSFLGEYIDSSLGMGYGTTLTPILLLLGFEPLQVVPAVLVSERVSATGLAAAAFHHGYGNVQLRRGSRDLNVALVLGGIGLLGSVVAALVAVRVPPATSRSLHRDCGVRDPG